MRVFFHSLRRRLGAALHGAASDDSLLSAYLEQHRETAFEQILERHGPMVFGVCQRGTSTRSEAEDAFQAVWLVFVQKANTIRPRSLLGNWLYGVAVNVARKAKVSVARRWNRERLAAQSEVEDAPLPDGLAAVLDEEVHRLPDAYRAAVLACDVEGLTRSAAAQRLGWHEGTVASRLSRGREMLARRLVQRGVGPASVGVVVVPAALGAKVLAASESLHHSPVIAELARLTIAELARGGGWRTAVLLSGTAVAGVGVWVAIAGPVAPPPNDPAATLVVERLVAPMPRAVPLPPRWRVLANPAADIRIVSDRTETVPEFFQRQQVLVAGLLEEKLVPLFDLKAPSPPLVVGYAAYNYRPELRVYGDVIRVAPPRPEVVALVQERIRQNRDRLPIHLFFVVDSKETEVFHLVGYTTRNTVSFFESKRIEPDPFSPAEFQFQSRK